MSNVPTYERPPKGLDAYWLGVWRFALCVLKDQGTWAGEQKPLLDEYVYALREAERARVGFQWLDHLGEAVASEDVDFVMLARIAGALPTQWDKHTKRASALASTLLLMPEARRQHGTGTDEKSEDPLARFAGQDEFSKRRADRSDVA